MREGGREEGIDDTRICFFVHDFVHMDILRSMKMGIRGEG